MDPHRPTSTIAVATQERFADLETLFGPRGAVGNCWCMWWRLSAREFDANGGRGNHDALEALVARGAPTGLLAYRHDEPVGWVSVAPRTDFGRLLRSPMLRGVDAAPAWSLVCLFVRRDQRGRGVARELVRAAVEFAASQGAPAVEAYPRVTEGERRPDESVYTGTPELFERAGFRVVARPAGRRIVMRRDLPRPARTPSP